LHKSRLFANIIHEEEELLRIRMRCSVIGEMDGRNGETFTILLCSPGNRKSASEVERTMEIHLVGKTLCKNGA